MHFSQIKETCLYVQDLQRTEAFYNGKLNLDIIAKVEGRHIFFKAGASVLLCFLADATKNETNLPAHFGEGKMHMALEVPETKYRQVKEWIGSKNIKIEHEQQWSENYQSFYFRDPDGHSIEIVPEGMWE